MGTTDKIIRIILAIVMVILYFTETVTGTLGYVILGLSVILALTSFISFCPLYALLGINSCPVKKE
ncbi:DUF2892 domain-containing protein [Flavobacterium sp.]|uniref:YgaP family membrane protein n=1 Tax=Flavobacterium sp. TaxID=239 RepID=UPI002B4B20D2|nr:DUF2892 domain-containing protein [Flavobacterium sp.]HLF52539.1 DUF2892 domain-containing protein [Flavobacterium sp.]